MLAALLPMLGALLANGGLNKVLAGFQQSGQGEKAASWVGAGANEPVSAGEVENAIGSDEIDRIAGQLGVSREEAAEGIATVLPNLVDQVSPEGELPADPDLDRVFDRLSQASVFSGSGVARRDEHRPRRARRPELAPPPHLDRRRHRPRARARLHRLGDRAPWWAQQVGKQVDGSITTGVFVGLFSQSVRVRVHARSPRDPRRRRPRAAHLAGARDSALAFAVILASPNLMTLGIVLGNGNAAHAGDRILDVEAPAFRGGSLAGAAIAVLLVAYILHLLDLADGAPAGSTGPGRLATRTV